MSEPIAPAVLTWEILNAAAHYELRRASRYIVAALKGPHLSLSTSARNGGQQIDVTYLVNHQSCEATMHVDRHNRITERGQLAYHDTVCDEIGLPPRSVVLMGTAANMNYAAMEIREDRGIEVMAVVTAGVHGNAACAGDPASWRETETGWEKMNGTINTLLLINHPLTESALARAVVTMTEAKSAALTRLAVPSLYSADLATGTGTDQYAIAAPKDSRTPLTSASPHGKLGELIGRAVRDATLESLRWQNGLEPSYTRGIFTALGRHGLREESFFDEIAPLLNEADLALMRRNSKAVFYEPLVASAAFAFAAVLDRIRYESFPAIATREALRQQAASIAAGLSAKPHLWNEFRVQLTDSQPLSLIYRAIALGWAAKWRP